MDSNLKSQIETLIASASGDHSQIRNASRTSGGCINDAQIIELEDGRRYFVKTNANAPMQMFEREARGLAELEATHSIRVPRVIGWQDDSPSFLVLEAIESSGRSRNFSETFGQQLAQMHRGNQGVKTFGWSDDNYLGSSIQPNKWNEDWVTFWRQQRLGYQFDLAKSNGHSDKRFGKLADRLQNRLVDLLTVDEPPCLIHGDLWSGNYMVGSAGEPVLIDPAVYYAHREAEFGMTTLFGGFDRAFYQAYEDVWPFEAGADDRIAIYRLYHLLNHLNLFGSSYLSGCLEIMQKYA